MARSEKAEQTYQKILTVASKLFHEQGYEKTSIQDILNELKMSKGAVYHHFKSKKEILDAIEEQTYQENMRFLRKLIKESTGATGLEKMSQVFMTYISSYDFDIKDRERMEAHLDPHTLVADIKVTPKHAKFLLELVEEGIRDGSIKTEYPLELMESFFVLFTVWINPIIYPRSMEEAKKRMILLQQIMKNMGAEFISNEMVDIVIDAYKKGGYFD